MDNPIAERLISLTMLQVLHSKLDEIHRLRGSLPEEVDDLNDDLEGMITRKSRVEEDIKRLKDDINVKNARIAEFKSQIEKYEAQQDQVKNNREFEALRKEVEYANLEILTSEKKIKQFQDSIEEKEAQLAETSAQLEAKRQELDDKKRELEIIIEETRQEERRYNQEIEKFSSRIEPRYLQGYHKIRNNMRNGLAVVSIDRNACGGCFSIIPPQVHIELKQRRKFIQCENCGRILVDETFFDEARSNMMDLVS
jgi:hypothetical protein